MSADFGDAANFLRLETVGDKNYIKCDDTSSAGNTRAGYFTVKLNLTVGTRVTVEQFILFVFAPVATPTPPPPDPEFESGADPSVPANSDDPSSSANLDTLDGEFSPNVQDNEGSGGSTINN